MGRPQTSVRMARIFEPPKTTKEPKQNDARVGKKFQPNASVIREAPPGRPRSPSIIDESFPPRHDECGGPAKPIWFLVGDKRVSILLPDPPGLGVTASFGERDLRRAGRFSRWETPADMFLDEQFRRALAMSLAEPLRNAAEEKKTVDIEIDCGDIVGWSLTKPFSEKEDRERAYESFPIGPTRSGLRVRAHRTDIRAEKTKVVYLRATIVRSPDGAWEFAPRIIHPGKDGFDERVSVFFSRAHPGA